MSGLPSPPLEDQKPQHIRTPARPNSKASKQSNRASKRASIPHEHSPIAMDGRHKRVWKACERCRMKKTKCDGESPCKRCKDDGLVCTAGSRKKTEFKQLPRGYAEVLENTQYALIATVQKLYTMVRNNESWELEEPGMNGRGQPVIHDIASRLGCLRLSPDLPYAFPEGADDFAELQLSLQADRSVMPAHDLGTRKVSDDSSSYSPAMDRTDRASSSESDHSNTSMEYNQAILSQESEAAERNISAKTITPATEPRPFRLAQRPTSQHNDSYTSRSSAETLGSLARIHTDFQTESQMFPTPSPFLPWSTGENCLGPTPPLHLMAHYRKQQGINRALGFGLTLEADFKPMQVADGFNLADGTIRPDLLDCNTMFEQMDYVYGEGYEIQMGQMGVA